MTNLSSHDVSYDTRNNAIYPEVKKSSTSMRNAAIGLLTFWVLVGGAYYVVKIADSKKSPCAMKNVSDHTIE